MTGAMHEVGGTPTWVEKRGAGEEVVLLLHGGFSHVGEFESNLWGLADDVRVVAYDRRAHGRTPDRGDWRRADLVDDAVAVLEDVVGGAAHLVGYSDGGVVAAGVVARRPDLVRSLTLLDAALAPSDWVMLPPEPDDADPLAGLPPELVQAYEEHAPGGLETLRALVPKAAALSREAFDDLDALAAYTGRVLVLCADDDLVTLESQLALYRLFGAGELAVVPGTSHDAPREKPALVTSLVRDFLTEAPRQTHLPIRRAG